MRRLHALSLLCLVVGCTTAAATTKGSVGDASEDGGTSEGPKIPCTPSEDGGLVLSAGPADYELTYRTSLSVCWTDPSCKRALTIAHGGDWGVGPNPYNSNAALAKAFVTGADGVKIDARMTKDGIAVVSHSSPLVGYESTDCANKKIEEMTAAEVTQCHRFPSCDQTFQRLSDVLDAMRGKLVVQVCVKVAEETPAIAAAVLAAKAEDFAFLEIEVPELQTYVPSIPNGDKLWYLVQVNQLPEVDTLLDTIKNPRAFMYEFEPTDDVSSLVETRLHPAGIRSFTYQKDNLKVADVKALFDKGFDVVSSNNVPEAVAARQQVNTADGINPP